MILITKPINFDLDYKSKNFEYDEEIKLFGFDTKPIYFDLFDFDEKSIEFFILIKNRRILILIKN